MVDFKKLLETLKNETPEEKAARQQKIQDEWDQTPFSQYKKKVDELNSYISTHEVNEFEEKFIKSVWQQVNIYYKDLSDKQKAKVDEFHQKLIQAS